MRALLRLAAGLVLALSAACATPTPLEGRLVDLSHAYGRDTVYWPTDTRGFEYERLAWGVGEDGHHYAAGRFATAEHGGTHLDAPIHFAAGGVTVDRIPLERLVGPGVLVDVRAACAADPDYAVGVADLERWERAHGRIPGGARVLLLTGWSARWGDRAAYLGTDRRGPEAVAELHFPGLHPEAARWLVRERRVGAVGLDTPSIDPGPSRDFESHRVLSEAQVPAFENLTRLDELPPRDFTVVALPMKITGGSGAPLRAVAILR